MPGACRFAAARLLGKNHKQEQVVGQVSVLYGLFT